MDCSNLIEMARLQAWQIGLLSVVALIGANVFGRKRPHLAHMLLLVVVVKCLTPPIWSSPAGIFCWISQRPTEGTFDDEVALERYEFRESAIEPAHRDIHRQLFSAEFQNDSTQPILSEVVYASTDEKKHAALAEKNLSHVSGLPALIIGWSVVSISVCLLFLVRVVRCIRSIRRDGKIEDPVIQQRVQHLSKRLKLRRRVRVYVTRGRIGPAVFGLFRPTIVIPQVIVREQTPQELDTILTHELLHVRRGDLWVNFLQMFAKALWWFHPSVWLVSRSISRTTEICCDEETIASVDCSPAIYARSLLKVVELKHTLQAAPSFPGIRPVEITSKRLERIMKLRHGCHQHTPFWCWLLSAILLIISLPGGTIALGDSTPKAPASAPDKSLEALSRPLDVEIAPITAAELFIADRPSVQIVSRITTVSTKHVDKIFNQWSLLKTETQQSDSQELEPLGNRAGEKPLSVRGASKTVIERNDPLKYALLDEIAASEVVEKLNKNRRANTISGPRVTVNEGQEASIQDSTMQPFVVGFRDNAPTIRVVSEGVTIQCCPKKIESEKVWLSMDVTLSNIRNVEESSFIQNGTPLTLQIPEVQKTKLNVELELPKGKTLVLGGLKRQVNNKNESVIIFVRADVQRLPERQAVPRTELSKDEKSKLIKSPKFWDLSLDECLSIGLQNSKVIRSVAQVRQFREGESESSNNHRTVIRPIRTDIALVDIENSVRGLVSEVVKSYWELYFFHGNLNVAKSERDVALTFWRQLNTAFSEQEGDAASKSQAQEQYFFFRGRLEEAKKDLMKAERRLRYLLGLAAADGRIIRPTDKPGRAKLSFDWQTILHETLANSGELKRQRSRVKDKTSQVAAMRSAIRTQPEEQLLKVDPQASAADVDLEFSLEMRAELAKLKNATLSCQREKAKLEDLELELSHSLTDAVQNLEASYQLAQTSLMQTESADTHVAALQQQQKKGTVTWDFLLDAQRRSADAKVTYVQSLVQYAFAISEVHYRKGSMLRQYGIEIAGAKEAADVDL